MKAILVIDMPSDCNHCQFANFSNGQWECNQYKGGRISESMKISSTPSWCPLKPIPKGLVYEGYDSPNKQISEAILQSEWGKNAKKNDAICIRSFSIGYNACLEEITGETE